MKFAVFLPDLQPLHTMPQNNAQTVSQISDLCVYGEREALKAYHDEVVRQNSESLQTRALYGAQGICKNSEFLDKHEYEMSSPSRRLSMMVCKKALHVARRESRASFRRRSKMRQRVSGAKEVNMAERGCPEKRGRMESVLL
jgi:hypothetical protein